MKQTICGLAVLAALSSAPVFAHQEGDFIVRAGIASVVPNDSSDKVLTLKVSWQLIAIPS